jgi:hypothetical protein
MLHEQLVLRSAASPVEANRTDSFPVRLGEGIKTAIEAINNGGRRTFRSSVEPRLASRA